MRVRLQKRIEELEPLPELLRQAEIRNQDLQNQLLDKDKRLMEHAAMISDLTSKVMKTKSNFQIFFFDFLFF